MVLESEIVFVEYKRSVYLLFDTSQQKNPTFSSAQGTQCTSHSAGCSFISNIVASVAETGALISIADSGNRNLLVEGTFVHYYSYCLDITNTS